MVLDMSAVIETIDRWLPTLLIILPLLILIAIIADESGWAFATQAARRVFNGPPSPLERKMRDLEVQLSSPSSLDRVKFERDFEDFIENVPPKPLFNSFVDIGMESLSAPPDRPIFVNEIEQGRYADQLARIAAARFNPALTYLKLAPPLAALMQKFPASPRFADEGIGTVKLSSLIGDFDAYLETLGPEYQRLKDVKLPFDIPLAKQLEHSVCAAGSRFGKSQLLGAIIARHLQSDNTPSMVIVEPTGDFARKLSGLAVFAPGGKLEGKLIIVNPADSPQLNMFAPESDRQYSEDDLENMEAATLKIFDYVFQAIGSELTTQQGTGFDLLGRLMLSLPNPTLTEMKDILETPAKKYGDAPAQLRNAIEKLDKDTQSYFKNHFFSEAMHGTRLAVGRRLHTLLRIPAFKRMFSGGNRIDFFAAMNDGMIIVVNTSKGTLQKDGSSLLGRYIIARVARAALERSVIEEMSARPPCLLFVDEAKEYVDESIDELLSTIGKYQVGIALFFQFFGQLSETLHTSVLGNCSVLCAGGLTVPEARVICKEMHVDDKMIRSQVKDAAVPPQWATFAIHVKYMTNHALTVHVPFYQLDNMPRMSDELHKKLLTENRLKLTGMPDPAPSDETPDDIDPPAPTTPQSPPDDPDAEPEWKE
jgi:hypothetical protein